MKKLTTEEFVAKAKAIHGDKYEYSNTTYIDARHKITIKCLKCNKLFIQTPPSHLSGRGCPICRIDKIKSKQRKSPEQFIIDANLKHNNKYTYNKTNYINATTNVIITCNIHGDFSQKPNNHLCGKGCPICKSSKGENVIHTWLKNKGISYHAEYSFSDCKHKNDLYFDFYIPHMNICIEYDGEFHFKQFSESTKATKKFTETKLRDSIKNEYCISKDIKLIRIPYWEFDNIDEILKRELN